MTLTPEEDILRLDNMRRLLDHTDETVRKQGKELKNMNRLTLNEIMYDFSGLAGIPLIHFQQAYAHLIAELNGLPSTFLEPLTYKKYMKMKKIEPMMPIQFLDKQDEKDEPTLRLKSQKVEPYFSPQMKMNS